MKKVTTKPFCPCDTSAGFLFGDPAPRANLPHAMWTKVATSGISTRGVRLIFEEGAR